MNYYTRLPGAAVVDSRQAWLARRCAGKRVLHLGCVDAGLLEERYRRGELVHQQLAATADELWGVDIDAEGIAFLRNKGFQNLFAGDVCALDAVEGLRGQRFDVVVASEVVEHLLNPGLLLSGIREHMAPERSELLITVPSAFRPDTLLWLLRGVEYVHPDHNYWFSYRTATNLVVKSGFEVAEVLVYSFQPRSIWPGGGASRDAGPRHSGAGPHRPRPSRIARLRHRFLPYLRSLPWRLLIAALYRRTPFWGDGLIVVARLPAAAAS